MVTLEMLQEARERLKGVARMTPLFAAQKIGEKVYIKAENLQMTGSFKLRGAYNKICSLTEEEKAKGVIACSAGNHVQGVAYSATQNGLRSVICIPAGAPIAKVEATRKFGGEVVLVPGVYDDAYAKAVDLQKKHGYTFLHPFDDEMVMAGQGTIGLEILEQMPDVEAVVVPIGGGGLIGGVATAIKTLKPDCKVYGVQAAGAPSMVESIQKQEIITLPSVSTIADGIAVKRPGNLTYEACLKYVDEVVTVTEDEIATAILTLMETHKSVAEGAGATSVAAVMFGKVDVQDKKTVCVVSGGNIDVTTLSRVITKGLTKTGRIFEFSTMLADKPGNLLSLLQVVAGRGVNIIDVHHERENEKSQVGACVVKMVLETRNLAHIEELKQALADQGYEILD